MTDLLRDYERKRGWAMDHFNVLRKSVEGFTNINREPIPGEFDRDASHYVFEVPLERINRDWTLRLGDFIYDTRASLDYLITALIRGGGNEENESSQFPIHGIDRVRFLQADQWWEDDPSGTISRQLKDTPSGTKAALKPLQPFYGVPRTDPLRHPLAALHILSNRDKHRRLNLLAHRASVTFVDGSGKPIYEGPAADTRISETYEGDTYTATLTVDEQFDVNVYFLPTYDIRLDEPPELFRGLIDTLAGINEYIDGRVLPTVRGLFPSP